MFFLSLLLSGVILRQFSVYMAAYGEEKVLNALLDGKNMHNAYEKLSSSLQKKIPLHTTGPSPSNQYQAIPVIRKMLEQGYTELAHKTAVIWLQDCRLGPHVVRVIHHNPRNWPLIKFLPDNLQDCRQREWAMVMMRKMTCAELERYLNSCGLPCSQ